MRELLGCLVEELVGVYTLTLAAASPAGFMSEVRSEGVAGAWVWGRSVKWSVQTGG